MVKRAKLAKAEKTFVYLPPDILREMDKRLHDPLRNRVRYGARTHLLTRLVREWLASHPDPYPPRDT